VKRMDMKRTQGHETYNLKEKDAQNDPVEGIMTEGMPKKKKDQEEETR